MNLGNELGTVDETRDVRAEFHGGYFFAKLTRKPYFLGGSPESGSCNNAQLNASFPCLESMKHSV